MLSFNLIYILSSIELPPDVTDENELWEADLVNLLFSRPLILWFWEERVEDDSWLDWIADLVDDARLGCLFWRWEERGFKLGVLRSFWLFSCVMVSSLSLPSSLLFPCCSLSEPKRSLSRFSVLVLMSFHFKAKAIYYSVLFEIAVTSFVIFLNQSQTRVLFTRI
jgi:hypothetical protein